ncbi:phenylalanine--tRNA ligase subunit beta [Buchnera aphidicola]|uniref:phenylalanine--tRNA ligase subunit beta n=1 Tax=Buchnera aphidicola TaxID=9 RepID=UPI0031B6FB64
MKFREEWLYSWIPSLKNSNNLEEKLNNVGIEVSYICKNRKSIFVSNVIIGTVYKIFKHPKNLNYCIYLIDFGKIFFKKILVSFVNCCQIGNTVIVALAGISIYKKKKVQTLNIFGVVSEGFFCSFYILNLGFRSHDIVILSKKNLKGLEFFKYFKKNSRIIKFDCPTNRIDLKSIFGISREISIIYKVPLPKIFTRKFNTEVKPYCKVQKNFFSFNSNYTYREIHNLSNKNIVLPLIIQERLRACNISFHNTLENLLYYIFLETGHWFHIFDIDLLEDFQIQVRLSRIGEYFTNIYKKKIFLDKNSLIISNKNLILSTFDMSQTFGAFVTKNTKNLFIGTIDFVQEYNFMKKKEIFFLKDFSQYLRYNIFSKNCFKILDYYTSLILKFCGGTVTPIITQNLNFYSKTEKKILVRQKKVNQVIGYSFSKKKIIDILKNNFFKYININNILYFYPPYWRIDIFLEEDVIGEIVNRFGCQNLPILSFSNSINFKNIILKNSVSLLRIKNFLVNHGYFEVITYSFINPKFQKIFFPKKKFLIIKNSISFDMSVMRMSIWVGLLNCISYHQKRQHESIRIFETGLCFFSDRTSDLHIRQEKYLACAISGNFSINSWNLKNRKFDFYDMKGIIESILDLCGKLENVNISLENFPGLERHQSAGIYLSGQLIGKIGVLDSSFYEIFSLTHSVILCEILWEKISLKNSFIINTVSMLPTITKDISIIVLENIISIQIVKVCKKILNKDNVKIFIYDVYYGKGIPIGYKSLSLRFIFQSFNIMLTDIEILKKIQNCINVLKIKFQAILRD